MRDVLKRLASVRGRVSLWMIALLVTIGLLTFGVLLLMQNITERQEESRQHAFRVIELDETVVDPADWGKNYPRQYDDYLRTVDTVRTRHGGSEAFSHLEKNPRWVELFNGYAFSIDYREERGHAYMLSDQDMTERVKQFAQPGACLHCHASVIPAYVQAGRKDGVSDVNRAEQIQRGFEIVCGLPYLEAREMVSHPVACIDCHDPQTMQLRVTRPGFLNGIAQLAASSSPVPHLQSVERWRRSDRSAAYNPNTDASRQEMRSFVCGQCHVEYYFKGKEKLLTYPWHNGLKMEEIERYYDTVNHTDWIHVTDSAPVLKAQHPEFETWSQGIHARSGVACADCHMPYYREGAIKLSDHHVRSPLLNINRACQVCHHFDEKELLGRAEAIQDRTRSLLDRAEVAVLDLIAAIEREQRKGSNPSRLAKAREMHRRAQWRLDFISAENSMGFHAPQESSRILGEAIDYARQGHLALVGGE